MPNEEAEAPRMRRDLKGDARRAQILDLLRSRDSGTLEVGEIARLLDVSLATVRRDLSRLRADGGVARTYGGVTLMRSREVPVRARSTDFQAAKDAIGRLAASLVPADSLVVVDAGTTTAQFAAHLADVDGLTVVTNGIGVINSLLDNPGPEIIVLGGPLRVINESIVGGGAEDALANLTAAMAFVGADAVDVHRGIGARTLAQSRMKSKMMLSAPLTVVLADSSKLRQDSAQFWSRMTGPWSIVTDSGATAEEIAALEEAGAREVHVATP